MEIRDSMAGLSEQLQPCKFEQTSCRTRRCEFNQCFWENRSISAGATGETCGKCEVMSWMEIMILDKHDRRWYKLRIQLQQIFDTQEHLEPARWLWPEGC